MAHRIDSQVNWFRQDFNRWGKVGYEIPKDNRAILSPSKQCYLTETRRFFSAKAYLSWGGGCDF